MAAPVALSELLPARVMSRHLVRPLVAAAVAVTSAWLLGLGWFCYLASRDARPIRHVDAIVVLTGGPERIEVALRLLMSGTADRLLVSGAGEKTDLAILAYRAGIDPVLLEQQTTLGHAARSTHGNALETASWAQVHGVGTLLVVTSWFHMPRALMELRRVMPAITILPYPVGRISPAELAHGGLARRVVGEYHKYLATLAGITASPFAFADRASEPAG